MNLTTARLWIRQFARSAGDSTPYPNADIDRAIQAVCEDFIFQTRVTRTKSTVAITSGSAAVDVSAITNFEPGRLLRAYIGTKPALQPVSYQEVLDHHQTDETSDVPSLIGFETLTAGQVWPTPDANYTLNLLWYPPFTDWTPGGADPGELNIPAPYLKAGILSLGVGAMLQYDQPEDAYQSEGWTRYQQLVDKVKGRSILGSKVHQRTKADW